MVANKFGEKAVIAVNTCSESLETSRFLSTIRVLFVIDYLLKQEIRKSSFR